MRATIAFAMISTRINSRVAGFKEQELSKETNTISKSISVFYAIATNKGPLQNISTGFADILFSLSIDRNVLQVNVSVGKDVRELLDVQ